MSSKDTDNLALLNELNKKSSPSHSSSIGLYATIGVGSLAVLVSVAAIPFVSPAFRKHVLPYVPATKNQIDNVFKAIDHVKHSQSLVNNSTLKLIDLGSGDGRIVFEAAKNGYKATGVELNTLLYLYSRFKAISFNQKPKPSFMKADLWRVNMSNYDLIVLFGVQGMMNDLAYKLNKEMNANSKIITCRFPMNELKSIYHLDDGVDSVWVYDKNSLKDL